MTPARPRTPISARMLPLSVAPTPTSSAKATTCVTTKKSWKPQMTYTAISRSRSRDPNRARRSRRCGCPGAGEFPSPSPISAPGDGARTASSTSGSTTTRFPAPSTPKALRHPSDSIVDASAAIITSWPTALPEVAMLTAAPVRSRNQRLTITPTVGFEAPAFPSPLTTPYSAKACQGAATFLIRARPTPPAATPAASMPLRLYRSARRPATGIASAETSMKQVTRSETVVRLHSRSSTIGLNIRPNANRDPPPKKWITNPVATITQPYLIARTVPARRLCANHPPERRAPCFYRRLGVRPIRRRPQSGGRGQAACRSRRPPRRPARTRRFLWSCTSPPPLR